MNEPMAGMQDPSTPHATHDKSAGTLLREAREAAGIHVSALAVSLKVPVKKLEALEADDLERLPDAMFARALAATVCRTLNVDPEPVLARLPQMHTPHLKVGSPQAAVRLDNRGAGMRIPGFRGLPRSVVYLTGLLLVGAVVVSMLPSWRIGGGASTAEPASGTASETVVSPSVAAMDTQASTVAAASRDAASAPAAVLPALLPSTSPAVAAAQAAASAAATASPAANTDAGNTSAIAVFTTRDPTWLQVVDSAGVVQVRKTLAGGETVRVQGSLPLSVVVGRANAIDVAVRGKPYDLAPVTKDNVARFQVK